MKKLFVTAAALLIPMCLVAGLTAGSALADTYDYTGNNFTTVNLTGPTAPADPYTTADSVTGSLTLSGPLGANLVSATIIPLSFSFSDGVNTLTGANTTTTIFQFSTDGFGNIVNWNVIIADDGFPSVQRDILTHNELGRFDSGADTLCGPASTTGGCAFFGDPFYSQQASNVNMPGTWTLRSSAVPEPASIALFGMGLLGLVGLRRRKRA